MSLQYKGVVAIPAALFLALSLCSCSFGGSAQSTSTSTDVTKDPVAQNRTIIWEPEDKELTAHTWNSDAYAFEVGLDDENDIVTDVQLTSYDGDLAGQYKDWVERYDSLNFVSVVDKSNESDTPYVSVCFFGLDDPDRAKAFVDAFTDVAGVFVLNDQGLLDNAQTGDKLHAADFINGADEAKQMIEELEELNAQLDDIAE